MGLLVAGTRYRGEFEERLKKLMEEIEQADDIILVIDEVHTLIGAGAAEGPSTPPTSSSPRSPEESSRYCQRRAAGMPEESCRYARGELQVWQRRAPGMPCPRTSTSSSLHLPEESSRYARPQC